MGVKGFPCRHAPSFLYVKLPALERVIGSPVDGSEPGSPSGHPRSDTVITMPSSAAVLLSLTILMPLSILVE